MRIQNNITEYLNTTLPLTNRNNCRERRRRRRRSIMSSATYAAWILATVSTMRNISNNSSMNRKDAVGIIKLVYSWSSSSPMNLATVKRLSLQSSYQQQRQYNYCNSVSDAFLNHRYGHQRCVGSTTLLLSYQQLYIAPSHIMNVRFLSNKSFSNRKRYRPSTKAIFSTNNNSNDSNDSNNNNNSDRPKKKRQYMSKKSKKIRIAEEITQANIDKLTAAFDELARKEGFDSTTSYFADGATFEDDFEDDDDIELDDDDDDDDDESFVDNINDDGNLDDDSYDKTKLQIESSTTYDNTNTDALLDPSQFRLTDFVGGVNNDVETNSKDDYMSSMDNIEDDDDMDSRINAAKRDLNMGRVVVPKQLDRFAEANRFDLSSLGFREEEDPWGNDEGPRKHEKKREYQLVLNAMICQACGADFQCSKESRPGYLPPEKFEVQVKLSKLEELERLQTKAENKNAEWTPEDEVEWLIQSATSNKDNNPKGVPSASAAASIDIAATAEEMGLDLDDITKKRTICKRCHGLQNFGKVDEVLRPGWTEEPLLAQEKFRDLLRPIREKPAVIVALVDLFDFSGSVLPELDAIAGDNPVILAANKVDLLPAKMGQVRAENWVRRELEYLGIRSLANIGGAVRLVSCKTGAGIDAMLAKARGLADEMDCDIYVVGAANAGKSTLLNYILGPENDPYEDGTTKLRAGNINKRKSSVTTSPLPGTTLKFIQVNIGGGRSLYDTPGLLVPGTLTQLLTPEELKIVIPKSNVEPITFRIASGKVVLVGGLAKIELIGDCKPFLFTFFVANGIKLHPTDASRADDFIQKNVGGILVPPLGGPERLSQLGEFESHVIDIEGSGWKEAAADITLTGLGWIAVTGAGVASVKVSVPKGVVVALRPPLMPFDIWESTARYTGSRAVRKTTKTKYGKKRKGVGRN